MTGAPITLTNDDWTWSGNTMVGRDAAQAIVRTLFIPTNFTSVRNKYWNPAEDKVFFTPTAQALTLPLWTATTGLDASSNFEPPRD